MAKIVYASFDEVPSYKGASTHILAFCRALAEEHEVTLLSLGDERLPAQPRFRHVPFPIQDPNYLKRALAFRLRVLDWLRRNPADVFHFRSPWEGLAGNGAPVRVFEVNGLPSVELPYRYPGITAHALEVLQGWEAECLSRADRVICPSGRNRDHLRERYRDAVAGKIQVIPNGYFPNPEGPPLRKAPDGRIPTVYLGTLSRWQGVFRAVRAWPALADRFTLDIYAPLQSRLTRSLERRIKRLSLTGTVAVRPPLHRAQLAEILSGYALGLCPLLPTERNLEQGCCPVKVLDYASCGVWTVAAALDCVREVVREGVTGFLYEPEGLAPFVAVMGRIHRSWDDLAALPRPSPRDGELLSWHEAGQRLRQVYRELSASAAP